MAAAATSVPSRGPRPWLAALLSLLSPGLGQLYLWRPLLALLCWLADLFGVVLAVALLLELSGPAALLLPAAMAIAIRLAIVVHAWRLARRGAVGASRPTGSRLVGALVAAVLVVSVVNAAVQKALRSSGVRAFHIPSGAMSPTVLVGDYLFVRTRGVRDAPRRHEEVVVYRWDGTDLLKRVAGLPGDTLAMRDGRLLRNGRALVEPYAHTDTDTVATTDADFAWQRAYLAPGVDTAAYHATVDHWGPLVVPADKLFVLGDERHYSLDSRYTGFIPADSVFGVADRVYFSRDPESGTVRWDRIGHVVR